MGRTTSEAQTKIIQKIVRVLKKFYFRPKLYCIVNVLLIDVDIFKRKLFQNGNNVGFFWT